MFKQDPPPREKPLSLDSPPPESAKDGQVLAHPNVDTGTDRSGGGVTARARYDGCNRSVQTPPSDQAPPDGHPCSEIAISSPQDHTTLTTFGGATDATTQSEAHVEETRNPHVHDANTGSETPTPQLSSYPTSTGYSDDDPKNVCTEVTTKVSLTSPAATSLRMPIPVVAANQGIVPPSLLASPIETSGAESRKLSDSSQAAASRTATYDTLDNESNYHDRAYDTDNQSNYQDQAPSGPTIFATELPNSPLGRVPILSSNNDREIYNYLRKQEILKRDQIDEETRKLSATNLEVREEPWQSQLSPSSRDTGLSTNPPTPRQLEAGQMSRRSSVLTIGRFIRRFSSKQSRTT